ISTNATISQSLISPLFDFANKEADSLIFYERRSSSHNSGILIEASIDGGETFTITLGDTLINPGSTSYLLRKVKLPDTLSNQPSVKIRWRVIGNGSGTSGTVRFDDITISALYHTDASVSRITFLPVYPVVGDSVIIYATIKNSGLQEIQNILAEFYDDHNNDSIPQLDELFSSSMIDQQLQPNDTIQATAQLSIVALGEKLILVKIANLEDQNPGNDIKRESLSVGLPPRSIVINEIMYAPYSPEPEWIELYNVYGDSIDLHNWKISNRNTVSIYTLTSSTVFLRPQAYSIITKDVSLFTAIHSDVPAQILQASSLPTYCFNNNGDAVVLFDHRGSIMDSVRYFPTWGGMEGKSLERIEYHVDSNDSTNWGTSSDSSGSTPGAQNYLMPLENDLHIQNLSSVQPSPNSVFITVTIRNAGYQTIQNFVCSLFYDTNEDSIPQSNEFLYGESVSTSLLFKDSIKIDFIWNDPPSGRKLLIVSADYPGDMRLSDNILLGEIKNSFLENALVVNEIMYEPRTGDAEYVELYNPGDDSIDIQEWKLTDFQDTSKSTKYIICQSPLAIGSGEFLVITFDSSIFDRFAYLRDSTYKVIIKQGAVSLNNDGDNIILTDLTGLTIDSVQYLPSWHNPDIEDVTGRALERINPKLQSNDRRNWSTSANPMGGSPGIQNSIYTVSIPNTATISFTPNPFSPDGDGFEDVTILSYSLPSTTALIRIRIFDSKGRLVRTLANSEPSGSRGEIIWDGYNDQQARVRIGIYIVLFEALDGFGGDIQTVKGTVVVATKL
ncbi:MAG: lamin tail domain-containing protein, partial [Ignavibacteriales bacterium]|nr:lamin tail domain-containing protein [Ignavibacteriales bacterium]